MYSPYSLDQKRQSERPSSMSQDIPIESLEVLVQALYMDMKTAGSTAIDDLDVPSLIALPLGEAEEQV